MNLQEKSAKMGILEIGLFLRRHWLVFALVGLVLGSYAKGRHDGYVAGSAAEQKAEAKHLDAARKAVKAREAKADKVTAKVSSDLTKTQTQIVYRTRTLIERIPTYVTPADDRACTLNNGWVRLHDSAASGGEADVPESPGGSDQAASGVQASEALATVLGNYGVAYEWRAEAQAWRDWYAQQAANWDKR